ncbi:Hypothetical predicted protein [Cloeon dipterum]|uniref:Odorant receptor n=1 Tax=Cloeon dipterum TaxID=197152 RepID=A0A8S1C687_9INSE|nr:Hypothetical predicted protein [Cloeon dipterum]
MEFERAISVLRFCGIEAPSAKNPNFLRFLGDTLITQQAVMLTILLVIAGFSVQKLTLFSILHILRFISFGIQLFNVRTFFSSNRTKLFKFIEKFDLHSGFSLPSILREEQKMRQNSMKFSSAFRKFIIISNMIVIFISLSMPLAQIFLDHYPNFDYESTEHDPIIINKHRRMHLWYEIWWPTDPREMPTYIFIMLWNVLCLLLNIGTFAASNVFIATMMVGISKRAQFLTDIAHVALSNGRSFKRVPQLMKRWIKYHQFYVSLVNEVNSLYGYTLMLDHLCYTYRITYYCYLLVKYSGTGKQCDMCYYFFMPVFYAVVQLLTQTSAGQLIITKSKELNERVVKVANHGLITAEGPLRSTLQTLKARCSCGVEEQITGSNLFIVSLWSLLKEFSLVASVLLVLSQIGV